MTRTWLSIQVELVEGRSERCWPRPGRIFAAARSHTFAQLADAIDDAFARWDRAHLHEFGLADGTRLTTPYGDDDEFGPSLDDRRTRLSRLDPREQFVYVFDFGDDWAHLCTVGLERIDPIEALGIVPRAAVVLGLGRHPRPVRPALGRGRRRVASAREPRRIGPAAAPTVVGRAHVIEHRSGGAPRGPSIGTT